MAKHNVYDRFEEIKKLDGVKSEYVYIMVNESIPRMVKIGATSDIFRRYSEIQNSLPCKTKCMWFEEVRGMFQIESKVRKRLRQHRASHSMDWFECQVHIAVAAFDCVLKNIEYKEIALQDLFRKSTPVQVSSLRELGQYCRAWRKTHKLTIAQAAAYAGVGVRFLSEFERGKPTCQFDLCLKICQNMGVDVFAARRAK